MKISVLMTTYNGSKYILSQMESIKKQTRIVDEVIICDDRSSDDTVKIINNFIQKNNLVNWKVIVNEINLGWKKNFIYNLRQTTGDIIFFCDQDDIWDDNKIEIMSNTMEQNSEILALSCYVRLIDENNNNIPLIKSLVANGNNTGNVYKSEFDCNFIFSGVAGCTMAIKRELYKKIENLDLTFLPHDQLFWELGILFEGAYNIDLDLLNYRIHSNNTTSANKNNIGKTSINKRINNLKDLIKKSEKFLDIITDNKIYRKEYKEVIIKDTIKVINTRINILESKNIFLALKLMKNKSHKISKTIIIGDISYALNINKFAGNILYKIYKKDTK